MLSIRLQRVGRKHEPVFRLVLTDSKNSTKSGRFLEILGSFDSRKSEEAKFDNEKVLHWISKGAQTSDTVHNLLLKRGIIKGTKRNVLSRKPAPKKAEEVVVAESKPEVAIETPIAPVSEPQTIESGTESTEDAKVESESEAVIQ